MPVIQTAPDRYCGGCDHPVRTTEPARASVCLPAGIDRWRSDLAHDGYGRQKSELRAVGNVVSGLNKLADNIMRENLALPLNSNGKVLRSIWAYRYLSIYFRHDSGRHFQSTVEQNPVANTDLAQRAGNALSGAGFWGIEGGWRMRGTNSSQVRA